MSAKDSEKRIPQQSEPVCALPVNRREALAIGALTAAAAMARPMAASGQPSAIDAQVVPPGFMRIATQVNGQEVELAIDPRASLLDVLREDLGLTGAKKGCDHGQCGACTVHVDGRRVASCLTLAAKADGRDILTIEGIVGPDGALHPMQQAFIDHDALQCGYCTPGQIMAAIACVNEGHAKSAESIREYMSGNICRCGAYLGIVAAIQEAARKMERA